MAAPSSARLSLGPALIGMFDAHSILFSSIFGGGFRCFAFAVGLTPTYHRILSPSSTRQANCGSGSKLMVYTYRLSWREVFRRGNTISPSGMNLGEEGDRQRVNGGNIENRQTERIFSSEPFWSFSGCRFGRLCGVWRRKRCHDARWREGAPSRQPIRCEHNTIKPLATTNFRT